MEFFLIINHGTLKTNFRLFQLFLVLIACNSGPRTEEKIESPKADSSLSNQIENLLPGSSDSLHMDSVLLGERVELEITETFSDPAIDSLKQLLDVTKEDTLKAKIMSRISAQIIRYDLDSALWYAKGAYDLTHRTDNIPLKLKACIALIKLLANIGEYDEAIRIGEKGVLLCDESLDKNNSSATRNKIFKAKSDIVRIIGIAYDFSSDYPKALGYYFEALRISEQLADTPSLALSLHNIGGVYMSLDKDDEALNYFNKAYALNTKIGNRPMVARNLANLAIIYSKQNEIQKAISHYKEAFDIFQEMEDYDSSITTLLNLGNLSLDYMIYDDARYYFEKALSLKDHIISVKTLSNIYYGLGIIYEINKDYKRSRQLQDSARSFALQTEELEDLEVINFALFELDTIEGKYKDAIHHLISSYNAKDYIHNEENAAAIAELKKDYEFSRKEAEIKAEQEKKDIRQRQIRNSIIAALLGSLLFLTVVYRQRNKIAKARKRSDELLLNILPEEVADELKIKGEAEAKHIDEVTVLFTDFKGFTSVSEQLSAKDLVKQIHECFSAFDLIMEKWGMEKIKTIGDAYLAVGGLPVQNETHAIDAVNASLDIIKFIDDHKSTQISRGKPYFEIRIGLHTGPVVAGIVGIKKFAYDIWGDTVNTASRMESSGEAGKVNISETTYELIKDKFKCTHRGKVHAKGKGDLDMYYVEGRL